MLKLLPPPVRDARLLDGLMAVDAQMRLDRASGSIVVEAHYSDGALRLIRLRPPHVDFQFSLTSSDTQS